MSLAFRPLIAILLVGFAPGSVAAGNTPVAQAFARKAEQPVCQAAKDQLGLWR